MKKGLNSSKETLRIRSKRVKNNQKTIKKRVKTVRKTMNILITNDDGYTSKGLWELVRQLKNKNKLTVIAPEREMSGASHSVSFFSGITYREIDAAPFLDGTFFSENFEKNSTTNLGSNVKNTENGKYGCDSGKFGCKSNKTIDKIRCFAVDGTPADCVIFGIRHLLKDEEIDLVVSGVNNVLNVGSDFIYSGTVGAAQEGTYLRHKSVALSLDAGINGSYVDTCRFFTGNLDAFAANIPENVTLNINVPYADFKYIKGVKITQIAYRPYDELYKPVKTEEGVDKYFISGAPFVQKNSGDDNDGTHIENGYITVVPIQLLSTDFDTLNALKQVDFKLNAEEKL